MDRPPAPGETEERLETLLWPWVEDVVAAWDLPGLAVGLVHHGDQVVARGFGARDRATGEPVTADTVFHLASISKSFVATAVLQLVEAGRLDLQTGVPAYLPDLGWADERAASVTLAQLLSHTSGLGDVADYGWHEPDLDDGALGRFAARVAGWPLEHDPGTRFSYSNAAYELLGHLVATVGGQTFEGHLSEHVLDPVGMTGSSFLLEDVPGDLLAAPHLGLPPRVVPGTYPYTRRHAPSSTLHSSAAELGHWMRAHLADGAGLLRPSTHRLMWSPLAETDWDEDQERIALGWFCGQHRDHALVGHAGSDPGFESNLALVPDLGIGVTVLVNGNVAPPRGLTRAALDVLMGVEPEAPPALDPEERHAGGTWGLIEVHRTDLAWPLLEDWRRALPESSDAWFMTGWAHEVEHRRPAAVEHLERALELDPDNDDAVTFLRRMTGEAPPPRPS